MIGWMLMGLVSFGFFRESFLGVATIRLVLSSEGIVPSLIKTFKMWVRAIRKLSELIAIPIILLEIFIGSKGAEE